MRQAADVLGISQPSVSRQMRALEKAVGGELFDRTRGGKVRISTLGAGLLLDARETLQHHHRLLRNRHPAAVEGPVIFVRAYLLGEIKKQMSKLYGAGLPRDARFTVIDDDEDMASLVESKPGSVAVFRTDLLPTSSRIISILVRSDSGSLYGAPELPAFARGQVDVEKLSVLVPGQPLGLREYTSRLLARAGIGPAAIKPGPQFIELLFQEVLEGRGAAVFFDDTVTELVEQGRLVRLLPVSEPYYLVLVAHRSIDPRMLCSIGEVFSVL